MKAITPTHPKRAGAVSRSSVKLISLRLQINQLFQDVDAVFVCYLFSPFAWGKNSIRTKEWCYFLNRSIWYHKINLSDLSIWIIFLTDDKERTMFALIASAWPKISSYFEFLVQRGTSARELKIKTGTSSSLRILNKCTPFSPRLYSYFVLSSADKAAKEVHQTFRHYWKILFSPYAL